MVAPAVAGGCAQDKGPRPLCISIAIIVIDLFSPRSGVQPVPKQHGPSPLPGSRPGVLGVASCRITDLELEGLTPPRPTLPSKMLRYPGAGSRPSATGQTNDTDKVHLVPILARGAQGGVLPQGQHRLPLPSTGDPVA